MARVFVTCSAGGLGQAAAADLLGQGHEVMVHARSRSRLAGTGDLVARGAAAVVGDLSSVEQTRDVAGQVNQLGHMDAVIHNAGVYTGPQILAVNVIAPYLLTAMIARPACLVYLSSGIDRGGRASVHGRGAAGPRGAAVSYSDSKLFVTTLAAAVARRCPEVLSNAVDPGWVPTRMGGRGAPDDLDAGPPGLRESLQPREPEPAAQVATRRGAAGNPPRMMRLGTSARR